MAVALLETDIQDLLLDDDGDIVLDELGLHWVSGIQAVVQAARIRMLFFLGEWFLNLDVGIPYNEDILFGNFNEAAARAAFTAAILDVPGVTAVKTLTFDVNAQERILTVTWSATCAFGDTPIDTLDLTQVAQPQVL